MQNTQVSEGRRLLEGGQSASLHGTPGQENPFGPLRPLHLKILGGRRSRALASGCREALVPLVVDWRPPTRCSRPSVFESPKDLVCDPEGVRDWPPAHPVPPPPRKPFPALSRGGGVGRVADLDWRSNPTVVRPPDRKGHRQLIAIAARETSHERRTTKSRGLALTASAHLTHLLLEIPCMVSETGGSTFV